MTVKIHLPSGRPMSHQFAFRPDLSDYPIRAIVDRLDRELVEAITNAENAGHEQAAAKYRRARLANALDGWRFSDDALAERWRTESKDRRRRKNRARDAVRRYEQAQEKAQ